MNALDLIVIGAGPGGYEAAIRAAQLEMRVAIVEADLLGGVCLNWGCIPTKAILSAAQHFEAIHRGAVPGVDGTRVELDYGAVIDASRKAASRLNRGVASLMKKNGIQVIQGRGRLAGQGQVRVAAEGEETMLSAPRILVATGSRELLLPGVNVDGKRVLTSREALESRELPRSVVVVGGGAVGLEFAYAYAAFGARVTVIEMLEQILPGFDREIAQALAQAFRRRNIEIRTGTAYRSLEVRGDGVSVTVEGDKGAEELGAEQVLFGVGRRACVEDIGLEAAGVELDGGFVKVGDDFSTSAEGIWAIGDVIGSPLLAHAASEEGIAAVEFMAGRRSKPLDYRLIPACIYCQPQVASVGLTEDQAREAGHDVKLGRASFAASGKAVGTGHTEGFVKLVADGRYGEILGCQIIGADATELIAEVTLAMALESTVRELGETCHAHPTLSEMVKEAALAVEGRAINL